MLALNINLGSKLIKNVKRRKTKSSGVARGHASWAASLGGAPAHFLQSFNNAF